VASGVVCLLARRVCTRPRLRAMKETNCRRLALAGAGVRWGVLYAEALLGGLRLFGGRGRPGGRPEGDAVSLMSLGTASSIEVHGGRSTQLYFDSRTLRQELRATAALRLAHSSAPLPGRLVLGMSSSSRRF
jgi:hypothetical protein